MIEKVNNITFVPVTLISHVKKLKKKKEFKKSYFSHYSLVSYTSPRYFSFLNPLLCFYSPKIVISQFRFSSLLSCKATSIELHCQHQTTEEHNCSFSRWIRWSIKKPFIWFILHHKQQALPLDSLWPIEVKLELYIKLSLRLHGVVQ